MTVNLQKGTLKQDKPESRGPFRLTPLPSGSKRVGARQNIARGSDESEAHKPSLASAQKGAFHRWPFWLKIDGAGKWKTPHLNPWNPSIFNPTNRSKGHLWRLPSASAKRQVALPAPLRLLGVHDREEGATQQRPVKNEKRAQTRRNARPQQTIRQGVGFG